MAVTTTNPQNPNLSGNEGEIAGIGTGFGAAFAPIDEANSVVGVSGHAEGVNEAGGEHGLLKAVATALAIEAWKKQTNCVEVIGGFAEIVKKFAKFGAL